MILPDFNEIQVPQQVLDYPSMATEGEKALLYWLAKTYYRGDGLIIDAGIFLGGSTNALATGIKQNSVISQPVGKSIFSYDIAIWVDSMNRYLEYEGVKRALDGTILQNGDSFEPVLSTLLASHVDVVELVIGNILDVVWAGRPIEIAFYDCLKTNDRDLAVFKAFAPHFIPHHTIILQQDFFHEGAAYNKIRQEYFSEYFEYLGQVSTTAVFRLVRAIPGQQISSDPVSALPLQDKIDLLCRAAGRAADNKSRILTQLAVVEFLIDENEKDLARKHLDIIEHEISLLSLDEITRRPQKIASGFNRRIGLLK